MGDAKELVKRKLKTMELTNEIAAIIDRNPPDPKIDEWIKSLIVLVNSIKGPHCKKCGRAVIHGKHMEPMTTPCGYLGNTPEV